VEQLRTFKAAAGRAVAHERVCPMTPGRLTVESATMAGWADRNRKNENEREREHPCAIRAHTPRQLFEFTNDSVQPIIAATQNRCEKLDVMTWMMGLARGAPPVP
jgi:hypothetical protein